MRRPDTAPADNETILARGRVTRAIALRVSTTTDAWSHDELIVDRCVVRDDDRRVALGQVLGAERHRHDASVPVFGERGMKGS